MTRVTVGFTVPAYGADAPFHADEGFPEQSRHPVSRLPNPAYRLLRRLLHEHERDAARFGTAGWNPFGELMQPGETVVIKPNFVLSRHRRGGDLFSIITHPSVLRAVVDYVHLALGGRGRIIIADVPQMDCLWSELLERTQVEAICNYYRDALDFEVGLLDMRAFALLDPDRPALGENRETRPGDPAGSVVVNLGKQSAFYGLPDDQYYGADFDRAETNRHHWGEVHEYSVSRTVLDADVVISVPKLKVHKKVGVTLNLKGLVGINTNKNYLVHYRVGTPRQGGDQLPDTLPGAQRVLRRGLRFVTDHVVSRQTKGSDALTKFLRRVYRVTLRPFVRASSASLDVDGGNWHGNDSAWRMTSDLARIFWFADRDGVLRETPQRRAFSIVDGIVGGEGRGPLEPDAKRAGCLVVGENLLAVDLVATRLMGFDPRKVKQFGLIDDREHDYGVHSFAEVDVSLDGVRMTGARFFDPDWTAPLLGFRPHPGWVGRLECAPTQP